jgi:nicotinamidase-related amidase
MKRSPLLLDRRKTCLVVVDIQERLLAVITCKEAMLQNTIRLIKGAAILGLPVLITEQYPKGLGKTVQDILDALAPVPPFEKLTFSACGSDHFLASLKSQKRAQIVLCGIEAHVCVLQTCLELISEGFYVFVAADAIASRAPENQLLALDRMRSAGAAIISTEMALFEMLEQAGTPEFKQIRDLVK